MRNNHVDMADVNFGISDDSENWKPREVSEFRVDASIGGVDGSFMQERNSRKAWIGVDGPNDKPG